MSEPVRGAHEDDVRLLRAWCDDLVRELRALEKRVGEMEDTVIRNSKRIANLTQTARIAAAVAERMDEGRQRRVQWWHVVLAVCALVPGYVSMAVLLTRVG